MGGTLRFVRWSLLAFAVTVLVTSCSSDPAPTDGGPGDVDGDVGEGDGGNGNGGKSCDKSADCDDGSYCTGEESCVDHQCKDGEAIECDDGIACTVDLCSDTIEGCISSAPDVDGDGHGDASCLDGDDQPMGDDCADDDANRFAGNVEVCDAEGHDEDCDLTSYGRVDGDSDTFLSAACCNDDGAGGTNCGDDCDDVRSSVNPDGTEACDQIDNDCDGITDEGVALNLYPDADRDGHGEKDSVAVSKCAGAVGFANVDDDCDDADISQHPGQLELCDGIDNNCNDDIDEVENDVTWYKDNDGDGYGNASGGTTVSCAPPANYSLVNTDCDDTKAAISPLAAEACDGKDNDCNGLKDFQIGTNDFEDDDGDGLIDNSCPPLGTDCDDTNAGTGPTSGEICDGRDNDCDDKVDEGANQAIWSIDQDGDGYGSLTSGSILSCQTVPGYARAGGDCDDNNAARAPGVAEACNAKDDDCDATLDETPASNDCPLTHAASKCAVGECLITQCATGFGNCDGNTANGCETAVNTVNNCGGCNIQCNVPNAKNACQNGQCAVLGCVPGYDDCDHLAATGCEASVQTPENCGGCGVVCDYPNASEYCSNQAQCVLQNCDVGYGDCASGSGNEGCETQTNTNAHCGGCNIGCNLSNVMVGGCVVDHCEINTCKPGWGECNRNVADGCETNTTNSVNNCGMCGVSCTQPNTTAICKESACLVTGCTAPYIDYNMDPRDGCETNSNTASYACGATKTNCNDLGFGTNWQCVGGTCQIGSCAGNNLNCDGNNNNGCESNTNDPQNCGSCGNNCNASISGVNGTMCNNGTCDYQSCQNGYSDCNANRQDGCEAATSSDPNNCGGCGIVCGLGGSCNQGQCEDIVGVAVGADFTCATKEFGGILCWGDNTLGQLGDAAAGMKRSKAWLVGGSQAFQFTAITAGAHHACALSQQGAVFCWGDNSHGQIGNGAGGPGLFATSPTSVMALPNGITEVVAGGNHTCAVTADGNSWCWGEDSVGQIGNGATMTDDVLTPEQRSSSTSMSMAIPIFGSAFLGTNYTIMLDSYRTLWGFGANGARQLQFDETLTPQADWPQLLPSTSGLITVWTGGTHACWKRQLFNNPFIQCWGSNSNSQLGDGGTVDQRIPVTVPTNKQVTDMALGRNHSCILQSNGQVFCWGDNSLQQCGSTAPGNITYQSYVAVPGPGNALRSLAHGPDANHGCAVTDSSVYCWGSNTKGQLGGGNFGGTSFSPQTVQMDNASLPL